MDIDSAIIWLTHIIDDDASSEDTVEEAENVMLIIQDYQNLEDHNNQLCNDLSAAEDDVHFLEKRIHDLEIELIVELIEAKAQISCLESHLDI